MIDYNMPVHVVEEDEGEYHPCLSFASFDEAYEFIKFAPGHYIIVTTEELEDLMDVN
jgi:hypothetical protein